eukprot:GHVO01040390.1.p1 GENE.GHVO01040390.1~~GHVO01040390.1.p1  ORF type:complete len:372 (-),score=73.12 GHVO01040390.1:114-1229(-)
MHTIIVDTAAFLRLKNYSLADGKEDDIFVTTSGVVREIRDESSRKNIALLLEVPQIRESSETDFNFVKAFATKTGDIGSLSRTDLEVAALTYKLHRELEPDLPIRTQPVIPVFGNLNCVWSFGDEKKEENQALVADGEDSQTTDNDDDDVSDDGTGWINDENIDDLRDTNGGIKEHAQRESRVICMTSDFALQNLCLQMGLNVKSATGASITSLRLWGKCCRSCDIFIKDSTKLFCRECGHANLCRVPYTVDVNGDIIVDYKKRPKNTRGTVFSVPKNYGKSKKQRPLITCEDSLRMGGRDRMHRHEMKMWSKAGGEIDTICDDNWATRKLLESGKAAGGHAAPALTVGFGRGNPNSNRWRKKQGRRLHAL